MRLTSILLVVVCCCFILGCSSQSGDAPPVSTNEPPPTPGGMPPGGPNFGAPGFFAPVEAEPTPVPIDSGAVTLSPENTKIEFVGTHVGENPDPRTGGFAEFTGQAEVDRESESLRSVSVEIQTESLWTQIPNLTNHLKSPDFFDAREYPTAKFQSTDIAASDGEPGQYTITGNLTLLDATKEISFPAEVKIGDDGLTLSGKFSLDRTEFGMEGFQERVSKEVSLTVAIGQKTQPQLAQGGPGFGGGPGGPRGGRRGGFDPAAIFAQRDADGDGKLTGDEISDRMRQNMEAIDTDDDGAITLEEFQERMRQFRAGRGGGGPGGGGPRGGPRGGGDPQRPPRPQRPEG